MVKGYMHMYMYLSSLECCEGSFLPLLFVCQVQKPYELRGEREREGGREEREREREREREGEERERREIKERGRDKLRKKIKIYN